MRAKRLLILFFPNWCGARCAWCACNSSTSHACCGVTAAHCMCPIDSLRWRKLQLFINELNGGAIPGERIHRMPIQSIFGRETATERTGQRNCAIVGEAVASTTSVLRTETMYCFPMRPVAVFNTLSSWFGIHSQVIDFGGIVNGDVPSNLAVYRLKRQPTYWRYFCIMCGIGFALSYPVAAYRLFLNYQFWATKSINFYLNYFYYSSRYFVVVSIFFMQVRYGHESCARQFSTINIFRQIYDLNRSLANDSGWRGECRHLAMALNVFDWWQMTRLIVAFVCYMCTNYLKLTYVFQRPSPMNAYDLCWFYYANIFIRLYASMFSISVLQQAKLFELLNRTIKAIKNAADESPAPSADRFISSGGQHRAHPHCSFEKRIKLLMKLHDRLRANISKLDKWHSIQAFSVVANGFMNMVSQVMC